MACRRICLPMQPTQVQSLGQKDPLEKKTATHSSVLAWKIPWAEEPSGITTGGPHVGTSGILHNLIISFSHEVRKRFS